VRGSGVVRARQRTGRTGILAAGIVVTFALGFVSLAQTVRVSATDIERDRLAAERQVLLDEQSQIRSDLNRLGREPAVRKQALDAGLGQLVDPLIVPAR
jgi:carbonic anhydrase